MDDGYRLGGVHPGVCTIPAAIDVDLPKGEPENPVTPEDLAAKFRSNAERMLKEKCDPLIALVMDLENHSVEELTRFFTS